jgi:hypothetical protein
MTSPEDAAQALERPAGWFERMSPGQRADRDSQWDDARAVASREAAAQLRWQSRLTKEAIHV